MGMSLKGRVQIMPRGGARPGAAACPRRIQKRRKASISKSPASFKVLRQNTIGGRKIC